MQANTPIVYCPDLSRSLLDISDLRTRRNADREKAHPEMAIGGAATP
jgi:hypothetical protein